jgi:hypothetical protein
MKKQKSWKITREEVDVGWFASTSGGRTKARQSRSRDIRSRDLDIVHLPTGVSIKDSIPPGNYSKKEMQKLTESKVIENLPRLEVEIKKHFPGYGQ